MNRDPLPPIDPAAGFPAQRYRLRFRVERAIRLPEFAGSALRGAFGHALRSATCVTTRADCTGCPWLGTCAYPAIFDTPAPSGAARVLTQAPHPFLVEPPPWGERTYPRDSMFEFDIVLLGIALERLPLVLLAWRKAMANGLGASQGTATLDAVLADGEAILSGPAGLLRHHPRGIPTAPAAPGPEVTMEFVTPLRLTRDGRTLGLDQIGGRDVLMSLLRRAASLAEGQLGRPIACDFTALTDAARRLRMRTDWQWRDFTRRSSRQSREMTLGGAVGTLRFDGAAEDIALWWPLLHVGQWLHVGKLTSMGLGHYRIQGGTS